MRSCPAARSTGHRPEGENLTPSKKGFSKNIKVSDCSRELRNRPHLELGALKFLLRKSYAAESATERQTDVVDLRRAGGGFRSFPIKGAELALPSLRVAIAVSLAYFTVAIFCINLAGEANNIASLWLPNAIGLVALLRHRPAVWPILLLLQGAADLSANVLMGSTLPVALGVAATDMLEVLLVAAALHWFSGDKPWFISSRWMLVFALASVCATAAAAFLGTGWLFLLGQETAFGATWRIWFLADTLGLIVVTPLLLGWTEKMLRDEFTRSRLLEVGLLTSVIALVAAFAFSQEPTPLSFLMFPFLLLITFRAGLLGATAGVVTLAITAMWLTLHGHRLIPASPGDLGTTVQHIQLMQIYILAAVISTLPIAVILKHVQPLPNSSTQRSTTWRAAYRCSMRTLG